MKRRLLLSIFSIFALASCINSSLASSSDSSFSNSQSEVSSISSNDSTISSDQTSNEISSSSEKEEASSAEEPDILEYEDVVNNAWSEPRAYRITPKKATSNEFTVFNVKFDTKEYLKQETTLTIKKTDYCYTYETVALYYQAFRQVPPNYKANRNTVKGNNDYRLYQTFTYGNYTGSNSYTESLGVFNNSSGKYLELDIDVKGDYHSGNNLNRGTGRVVIVVDGVNDYGEEPVCYFTLDHYSHFSEFYNYAGGWGRTFIGVGSSSSVRDIVPTVSYN